MEVGARSIMGTVGERPGDAGVPRTCFVLGQTSVAGTNCNGCGANGDDWEASRESCGDSLFSDSASWSVRGVILGVLSASAANNGARQVTVRFFSVCDMVEEYFVALS